MHGEFRPGGVEREWCDPDVLRRLRRRSLAALRKEVEPVDAATLGRFLPAWQGAVTPSGGSNALVEAIGRLARRRHPRIDPRARRPAGARPQLPPRGPRRHVRGRRSGVGRCGGARRRRRAYLALLPRSDPTPGTPAARQRPGRRRAPWRSASTYRLMGPRSGPTWCGPSARPTSSWCSARSGTSSGPARSPTTRWHRCGPW